MNRGPGGGTGQSPGWVVRDLTGPGLLCTGIGALTAQIDQAAKPPRRLQARRLRACCHRRLVRLTAPGSAPGEVFSRSTLRTGVSRHRRQPGQSLSGCRKPGLSSPQRCIGENSDGFHILVRDSYPASGSGTYGSLMSAGQVEYMLGDFFHTRGYDPKLAPMYA